MNSGAAAREVPAEENVDMDTKDEKPVGNAAQVSDETSVKAPVEQEQPNAKVLFMSCCWIWKEPSDLIWLMNVYHSIVVQNKIVWCKFPFIIIQNCGHSWSLNTII